MGAAAGIGADQDRAGQLRQGQRGGVDVLAGGVGSGVPRAEQEREPLTEPSAL